MRILYIIILLLMALVSCNTKELETVDLDNRMLVLENGVLLYNKTPFSGNLVSYHENGSLKSEAKYVNGKKHGYDKQWYANELLAVNRNYRDGLKSGIHKAWWENGRQKFSYHFNDKGEYNGSIREWYKTGNIFRDFNYVNGKEVGSQRLWTQTGNIRANYEVVNGERFGLIGLKKCYKVTVGSDEVTKIN